MTLDAIDLITLLLAAAVCLGAGVLKGSIGFGFPLVAVPTLSILVGTRTAIILVSVPLAVTNVALLARRPVDRAVMRRFLPLVLMLVPTTVAGALLLAEVNVQALSVLVGLVTVAFSVLSLSHLNLFVPPRYERGGSILVGAAAGLLHGTTSIAGPIFALFLTAVKLPKREFVYCITFLFSVGNVVQVVSYAQLGLYAGGLLLAGLLLIPAALLGQNLGFRIQDRLDPERFRRIVLVVVGLAGANLVVRGLGWG